MPDSPDSSDEGGVVLAVPAVVRESSAAVKSEGEPAGTVVEGQEYENLVTHNQYYEQVQFAQRPGEMEDRRMGNIKKEEEEEEGLYSIPQVMSLNNSTTTLTRNQGKDVPVDDFGMGRRFPSMRNTLKREKKKKTAEEKQQKTETFSGTLSRTLEGMYAKPKKISLSLSKEKNPSLVIHTKKTQPLSHMTQVQCKTPDDESSYMSVHFKPDKMSRKIKCPCSKAQVTKYLVMATMVLGLLAFLSVGLYLMSGNVVTIDRRNKNAYQGSRPSSRSRILCFWPGSRAWKAMLGPQSSGC